MLERVARPPFIPPLWQLGRTTTMFRLFTTLLFISVYFGVGDARNVDFVCRKCGQTITKSKEFINVTAPSKAKYSYAFPIAGQNYTISVLQNPAGQTFHVVGSKTGALHFHGSQSSDATWFPGMAWTICVCQKCKEHMGWYFQPADGKGPSPEKEKNSFIGIVLENIISADYTNKLTRVP